MFHDFLWSAGFALCSFAPLLLCSFAPLLSAPLFSLLLCFLLLCFLLPCSFALCPCSLAQLLALAWRRVLLAWVLPRSPLFSSNVWFPLRAVQCLSFLFCSCFPRVFRSSSFFSFCSPDFSAPPYVYSAFFAASWLRVFLFTPLFFILIWCIYFYFPGYCSANIKYEDAAEELVWANINPVLPVGFGMFFFTYN